MTKQQDCFDLLIKYEKWVLCLLGLNLLLRMFLGSLYYIRPLNAVRFGFWLLILIYLNNLIRTTKEYFKSPWCKNTIWWRIGIVFSPLQYIIAPIWMHLIARKFNGQEEQKSRLHGYAITCTVLGILIYAHLFLILNNG